jgi:hypothetical protein
VFSVIVTPNTLDGTATTAEALPVSDTEELNVFATTTASSALAVSDTVGLNVLPATTLAAVAVAASTADTPINTSAVGLVLPLF